MALDHIETEALARKILLHSRRRISHIAPILLESIYALPERVRPLPGPLSTDGKTLWFDPERVVEDFRKDRDAVACQLLHVTVHCLLGHLDLRATYALPQAFDCAADLKAAQLAAGLCGSRFASRHSNNYANISHLQPLYQTLSHPATDLHEEFQLTHLKDLAQAACFDNHDLWAIPPHPPNTTPGANSNSSSEEQCAGRGIACEGTTTNESPPPDWARIRQSMLDGNGGELPGNCAGMLQENFSVPDRGMSFAQFLKRFASPEERMLLDPDTFDIRWYHLGLEYYGDIPLLEPSELSEPPLPDDIVVALDVSGSCHGEVCKRFLKETLGILRDISAGTSHFRILLLLCDTEIQKEVLLETPEQVDALFDHFSVTGFGGTDFRPVFERVEQLRQSGALPRVRGLLYLSDGCGHFPNTPPDYPTAFLIPEEDRRFWPKDVNWVTCLFLNDTDFTCKEASRQ